MRRPAGRKASLARSSRLGDRASDPDCVPRSVALTRDHPSSRCRGPSSAGGSGDAIRGRGKGKEVFKDAPPQWDPSLLSLGADVNDGLRNIEVDTEVAASDCEGFSSDGWSLMNFLQRLPANASLSQPEIADYVSRNLLLPGDLCPSALERPLPNITGQLLSLFPAINQLFDQKRQLSEENDKLQAEIAEVRRLLNASEGRLAESEDRAAREGKKLRDEIAASERWMCGQIADVAANMYDRVRSYLRSRFQVSGVYVPPDLYDDFDIVSESTNAIASAFARSRSGDT